MDLNVISLVISILGTALAGGAVYMTYRVSYLDRLNSNTWATYEAYNNDRVRTGRAVARMALKKHPEGFVDLAEYTRFFSDASSQEEKQKLTEQEQNLHDLMAFYHQAGLLLKKRQVDKDFILLMLGAGLHDRWTLLSKVPTFYEDRTRPDGDFPYGGMYLLHETYLAWQRKRFAQLKQHFKQALEVTEVRAAGKAEA